MWLVPLLPFLAFFVILFFGRKMPGKGHWVGIGAVGLGLLLSLVGFFELAGGRGAVEKSWTWFQFGGSEGMTLELGMRFDFLTGVMFVIVTAISLLVQIYSTGYMHDDSRYSWFYAVLSLFTSSMLFLVLSNNLLQMFVGWEGVGVCSYFLIGHYWEEKENSSAAIKAFITTRIGDVGFLFGIFALFALRTHVQHHRAHPPGRRGRDRRHRPDRGSPAAVSRSRRKVRAVPTSRVASGRHGGPDSGLGADPRSDDGRRRYLPRRADVRAVRACRRGDGRHRDRGVDNDAYRCVAGSGARRHQEGSGVLDHLSARAT